MVNHPRQRLSEADANYEDFLRRQNSRAYVSCYSSDWPDVGQPLCRPQPQGEPVCGDKAFKSSRSRNLVLLLLWLAAMVAAGYLLADATGLLGSWGPKELPRPHIEIRPI